MKIRVRHTIDLKRLQADLEELLKRVGRALNKEGSKCFIP